MAFQKFSSESRTAGAIGHRKNNAGNVYCARNTLKILKGGSAFFSQLLYLIKNARESIHLQTYIFKEDETGSMVAIALKEAVARGVEVHLLVDGYASQALPNHFVQDLKAKGIHFRFFEPFLKSRHFYFGRRLHHKVVVIDGEHAMVGGINIADRYNDVDGIPSWLDFALYVQGEVVQELCVLCWKTWQGFSGAENKANCDIIPAEVNFPVNQLTDVRMRRNDWVRRKNEISITYLEMLHNATSHVTIMCSYFLPGKIIRRALRSAASRGVKIKVITAGTSDVTLGKNAERWMYDWLLRCNIELYEYQPTVLHAKVALCDDTWFTLGSYNVNDISTYASIELNLDVDNVHHARHLQHIFDDVIRQDCMAITAAIHQRRMNMFVRLLQWISYKIFRMAFVLVTFYYKKDKP